MNGQDLRRNVIFGHLMGTPTSAARESETPRIDAFKGLMMLLIMLGHDPFFTASFPRFFPVVNSFHVISFLLLPFIFPSRPLSRSLLIERIVRYLVPYAAFAFLSSVLFRVAHSGGKPTTSWLTSVVLAIIRGSPTALKEATGLSLFWFLPALFSVAVLRGLFERASPRWRLVLGAGFIAGHLTLGIWPDWIRTELPTGLPVAIFVMPLGWVGSYVWTHGSLHRPALTAVSLTVAIGCGALALAMDSSSNMGGPLVWALDHPGRLLLHDLYALGAFLGILGIGRSLATIGLLVALGRDSLSVYLTHWIFLQSFVLVIERLGSANGPAVGVLITLGSIAVMIAGSLLAARALRWAPLRQWITPRKAEEWPPLRRRLTAVAGR